ncbi:hypothetical protein BRARA_C01231 [Brassica rapa]|uniref:Uncharacterized protein n=1 Tax=Brassica campestris TaxID=3711 RepID=A0A397ZVA3_BRACM|nr:hypothetical protein BRARA_C01231 [Brassica rapa]
MRVHLNLRNTFVPVQVPQHHSHRRPRPPLRMAAQQPHHERQPRLLLIVTRSEPRVHRAEHLPARVHLHHPIGQEEAPGVRRLPPGDDLQQHNAERENVGSGRGVSVAGELRRHVPDRADDDGGVGEGSALVEPGEAEVSEPRVHLIVDEDVARFNVSVDHDLLPLLVEVEQPRRDSFSDLKTRVPG